MRMGDGKDMFSNYVYSMYTAVSSLSTANMLLEKSDVLLFD